jgi:hypothetical protein
LTLRFASAVKDSSGFWFDFAYPKTGIAVEKIKQVCLAFFVAMLLGINSTAPALAEDGGDDGGFDDGGFDDGGADDADDDNDQDKDGDGRPDKDEKDGHGHKGGHGHHGKHHHDHHIHPYYGGWGFGPAFGFGAFGYMPPYYPPAYYGYPPAAGRFVPPAVYIERKDMAQPAQPAQPATGPQANFWHYCRSTEGYYPQVKECPDGWEQVAPAPQAADKNDQE